MRFLLVLVTVVACACGGPTDHTSPAATPSPLTGWVLVTENDRAVSAHVGQKIEVVLHARSGMSNWSNVNVDDDTVLRAVPTGITAAVGVTIAGYEAAKPGTATIRATATPLCSPNEACPAYAMIFEVRVTVTP